MQGLSRPVDAMVLAASYVAAAAAVVVVEEGLAEVDNVGSPWEGFASCLGSSLAFFVLVACAAHTPQSSTICSSIQE